MKLGELLKKTDIVKAVADMDAEVNGLSFNSRTLSAGEVFVAIKGFEHDGHEYIEEAVKKGASCIICEDDTDVAAGTGSVVVKNSRKALAELSAAWFGYPAEKLKIIGVTGTNGKTTVTSLIKQVIEACTGEKAGLIGTNANMIGERELHAERTTPESFEIHELLAAMVTEGCKYAVMEVSSHALRLYRVHGIEFEAGVFTNLTPEHLDFHASMEDYADAKMSMFTYCRSAAINLDDESARLMISGAGGRVLTYALNNAEADITAMDIKLYPDRAEFCALSTGSLNRCTLGIPGMFSVYNALAAISAAALLGIDAERSANALKNCKGVKGRAEVVPIGQDYTVIIDYAHTPDALRNIITTMRATAKGRVVTLFGCGGNRDRTKRPVMGRIAAEHSDFVIVTSDNPRMEEPRAIIDDILGGLKDTKTPYIVIENRREAIHWALERSEPDDVLILAGKGHETYQIFGKEKRHFDEREAVAEYFGGTGGHAPRD